VTGAGVVTTGPHTASFLNVQNFLQNYLHLHSALVQVGMGECSRCSQYSHCLNVQNFLQNYLHLNSSLVREEMGGDGVVTASPHMASFLNVQNFLQNYQDLYLALQLVEEGSAMSKDHPQWPKMFFFLMCKKFLQQFFEFVYRCVLVPQIGLS
jgi:hypothetical protein